MTTAAVIKMLENLQKYFICLDARQPDKGLADKAKTLEKVIAELSYRLSKPQIIKSGVVCCGTCGHRVKDGYTYCNHCGQKQGNIRGGDAQ